VFLIAGWHFFGVFFGSSGRYMLPNIMNKKEKGKPDTHPK